MLSVRPSSPSITIPTPAVAVGGGSPMATLAPRKIEYLTLFSSSGSPVDSLIDAQRPMPLRTVAEKPRCLPPSSPTSRRWYRPSLSGMFSGESGIRIDDPELVMHKTCVRLKKESLNSNSTPASRRKSGGSVVKLESGNSVRQGKHVVCPAMSIERKNEAVNILQQSLPGLPEGHVQKSIFSSNSSRFECWGMVLDGGDGDLVSAAVFARHYKFGFIELAYIATGESYRGSGYGRGLLHSLMQQWVAEGFTEVISSVHQKAVGFFQTLGFEETIRMPKFVYSQWIDTYASSKTMGCDIGVKLARMLGPRAIMGSKRISADPGCPVSVLAGQENAPGEDEVWCRARITNNQTGMGLVTITYRHGTAHRVETLPTTCPRIKIGDSSNTSSGLPHFPASTKVHQYSFGMGVQWPVAKCTECADRRFRVRRCKTCQKCLAKHCTCRKGEAQTKGVGGGVKKELGWRCNCNGRRCMECGNCLAQHCSCNRIQNEEISKKRLAQMVDDDPFDTTRTPMKILKTEEGQSVASNRVMVLTGEPPPSETVGSIPAPRVPGISYTSMGEIKCGCHQRRCMNCQQCLTRHCQCDEPTPYPQNTKTRKSTKQQQPDTPYSGGTEEQQQQIPPSPPMPFPSSVPPQPAPTESTPIIPNMVALAAAAAVAKVAAKNNNNNSNISEKSSVDENNKPGVGRRRTRRSAGKGGGAMGRMIQNTTNIEMPYPRIEPMTTRRRTRSMSKDTEGTLKRNSSTKDDSSSSASTSSAKPNSSTSATGHKYGDYRTAVRDRRGNVLWTAASGVSCPCHHRKCDRCGLCVARHCHCDG